MTSPRVAVFLHVPFEGLGLIEPALARAGIEVDAFEMFHPGIAVPDVSGHAGIVSMGGPQSANDPLASLEAEIGILASAAERGVPVLGVCLGSQLIARALGARVYRNPVKEIGWFPVAWTAAAAEDPLFCGMAGSETLFHWHGETFDLPAGAKWLAYSDGCRHQAFRHGTNVWGLQFHLEVTPAIIERWSREDANQGEVRELAGPIDPHANTTRLAELSATVFGRWASLVCGDPASAGAL
jgi:GMP synthase (glutamine-hydrolysing)